MEPEINKLTSPRRRGGRIPEKLRPLTMAEAKAIADDLRSRGIPDIEIAKAIHPFKLSDVKAHGGIEFPLLTKSGVRYFTPAITKEFTFKRASIDGRIVIGVISTDDVDRMGDVLIPQGCVCDDYLRNPVVYFAHKYDELPVAKCVSLKVGDHAIVAATEFAPRPPGYPVDQEWIPDTLLSLYQSGVIRGWSVGLNVIEGRGATRADQTTYGADARRIITRWELVEYSVAPIPANPSALTAGKAGASPRPVVRISIPPEPKADTPKRVTITIPRYRGKLR